MSKPRAVHLEDIIMIERIGPNYSDHGFSLKFTGETPGGRSLEVIVHLPAWGIEEVARRLHEAQRETERLVSVSRDILEQGQ